MFCARALPHLFVAARQEQDRIRSCDGTPSLNAAFNSRNELTILVSSKDDQQNQLFVFFPDEPKVGMNTVTKYGRSTIGGSVLEWRGTYACPILNRVCNIRVSYSQPCV